MSRHPEARQEGDGKLEDEGGDMRGEGDGAEMKQVSVEHEMVEDVIEHPFQRQVQAAASTVAEQLQGDELPKGRIEEIDDPRQQALNALFYGTDGVHRAQLAAKIVN